MDQADAYMILAVLAELERADHRTATAPNRFARLSAEASHQAAHERFFAIPFVRISHLIWPGDRTQFFEHLRREANDAISSSE